MGGITSYFHGEPATVGGHSWTYGDGQLTRVLELVESPFRQFAYDYQSDIRVDPAVSPGDDVVYVRVDGTCGLWVRNGDHTYPRLDQALARRRTLDAVYTAARRSEGAAREAIAGCEVRAPFTLLPTDTPPEESPTVDATFFISYSRWNALAARQVQQSLERYAKVQVWFDLARAGEAPDHTTAIEAWLRQAISDAKGLVVLLTGDSIRSDWVARELKAARDRAAADKSFKAILVKMDESPVPPELRTLGTLVDADRLWYAQGLNEEIFAAVYGYESRATWRSTNARAGYVDPSNSEVTLRYADLVLPSGIARTFEWEVRDGALLWTLEYDSPDGSPRTVEGRLGPDEAEDMLRLTAVDFGIRPGDRVGAAKVLETRLAYSPIGPTVWMRSEKLDLVPAQVASWYMFQRPWDAVTYRPTGARLSNVELDANDEELAHRIAEMLHDAGAAAMMEAGISWQPFGAAAPQKSSLLVPFANLPRDVADDEITKVVDVLAAAAVLGLRVRPTES